MGQSDLYGFKMDLMIYEGENLMISWVFFSWDVGF